MAIRRVFVLDVLDYDGTPVRLCRERWYNHILAKRPWMASYLPEIQIVITAPKLSKRIITNERFPDCLDYYMFGLGRGKASRLYLKVVIQFYEKEGQKRGWIRTAFFVSELSRKGDLII